MFSIINNPINSTFKVFLVKTMFISIWNLIGLAMVVGYLVYNANCYKSEVNYLTKKLDEERDILKTLVESGVDSVNVEKIVNAYKGYYDLLNNKNDFINNTLEESEGSLSLESCERIYNRRLTHAEESLLKQIRDIEKYNLTLQKLNVS